MTREDFERLLDKAVVQLNAEVRLSTAYHKPLDFEKRVFEVLKIVALGEHIEISPSFHPHAFPDIRANGYGIEVKSTNKDSWQSVGNSIFEGMREPGIQQIYVVFGKMGAMPSVKCGRYEDRITHVRISHAPRFVLEMDRDSSLFGKMDISYDDFSRKTPEEKMRHVRLYSRGRLKEGERLWWLEDENSAGLPLEIKLYMSLPQGDKIKLRAEGAILFPQICGGSRVRNKYNEVSFFFLKFHNVFCPQARDLYSAGSVAGKQRGGNYLLRSLLGIEGAMREATLRLDDELFVEHWEESVPPEMRIRRWLQLADGYARNWRPSDHLFRGLK